MNKNALFSVRFLAIHIIDPKTRYFKQPFEKPRGLCLCPKWQPHLKFASFHFMNVTKSSDLRKICKHLVFGFGFALLIGYAIKR